MISLVPSRAEGHLNSYKELDESSNEDPLHNSLRGSGKDLRKKKVLWRGHFRLWSSSSTQLFAIGNHSQVMDTHMHEDKRYREYDNRRLNDGFGMEGLDNARGRLSIVKSNARTQWGLKPSRPTRTQTISLQLCTTPGLQQPP